MKYYVKSHDLEVMVGGPHIKTPIDAACEAFLKHYNGQLIASVVIVNERGFDLHSHRHEEDHRFDTVDILAKAGFVIEDE